MCLQFQLGGAPSRTGSEPSTTLSVDLRAHVVPRTHAQAEARHAMYVASMYALQMS